MRKIYLLVSVLLLDLVDYSTSTLGIYPVYKTLPPFGSRFYDYANQCGKANLCKHPGDIGCDLKRRIKRETSQGEDYIRNGEDVPRDAYPWVVALVIQKKLDFSNDAKKNNRLEITRLSTDDLEVGRFLCSATLISTRHLLSAKHCFQEALPGITNSTYGVRMRIPKDVVVAFFGAHRFANQFTEFTHIDHRDVLELKIPPRDNQDHDLALLRIQDVQFSDYIRPICLPFDGIPISEHYSVAGWGSKAILDSGRVVPNKLQQLRGLMVTNVRQEWPLDDGHIFNPHLNSGSWAHNGTNVTNFFYVNVTDDRSPCGGDSGAALTWQDPDTEKFYLMGILWAAWNKVGIDKNIHVCNPNNKQRWKGELFTKVTFYMDYIYREMNPDGYSNNVCRPDSCRDPNTTYVGKDGILFAPCGDNDGIGYFCLKGGTVDVTENRINEYTSKGDFLDNGFAECVRCGGGEKNWNYQQWINEITLGSFNQRRYYGVESPYKAFASSYFKGVFKDDDETNPHSNIDYHGEVTCPHAHLAERFIIPTSVVCDGFKDCPNAWDESPHICIGKCDATVMHKESNETVTGPGSIQGGVDVKKCFDDCLKEDRCEGYEWAATSANSSTCIFWDVYKTNTRPSNKINIRGPKRCPDLLQPGNCRNLLLNQNRNGAFRIQDYRGYFVEANVDDRSRVDIKPIEYKFLMQNDSIPSKPYQGNPTEWIFEYHGDGRLEHSYVTISNGIIKPTGRFSEPMYLSVSYDFYENNDGAKVYLGKMLPDFHNDRVKFDQRFYLQHLYEITGDKDDLMDIAIYSKYYDPKEKVNITVRLFSDFKDDPSGNAQLKLTASGPKKHPHTAKEGKFRLLECDEMLPQLKRVYDTPPKRADDAYEECMKYADVYKDLEMHFSFGISFDQLQALTLTQRAHLVKNICRALADSDHIWDYAGKMRIGYPGFRRMYETIDNVKPGSGSGLKSTFVLYKLKPYYLKNTT